MRLLLILTFMVLSCVGPIFAQTLSTQDRDRALDRTSGKVMVSRWYPHQIGMETQVRYGVSVTNADLIMSDGKSLENTGIAPDEVSLPSAEDLRAGKDTVLARAVAAAGGNIDPVAAGKFTAFRWKP